MQSVRWPNNITETNRCFDIVLFGEIVWKILKNLMYLLRSVEVPLMPTQDVSEFLTHLRSRRNKNHGPKHVPHWREGKYAIKATCLDVALSFAPSSNLFLDLTKNHLNPQTKPTILQPHPAASPRCQQKHQQNSKCYDHLPQSLPKPSRSKLSTAVLEKQQP